MPLGTVLGEYVGKTMAVRQTDLGGGQVRVEIDFTGEVKGQTPGQFFSTMVLEGAPGQAMPYRYTGVLLAASGGVARLSGRGVRMRTGEGHKARHRGAACAVSDHPSLAALNNMIVAEEFETDPATLTIKGAFCEWK
jgi:hypothetical protein